jgi:hypothetical protein
MPWSYLGWSSGGNQAVYPGGGLILVPQPDIGVMRVLAWWPDATLLQVVRTHPDGSRAPVRGAHPVVDIAGVTRRNYATNPSVETGLNGYVPGVGSPTLSRIERTDLTGQYFAWRAVNAGAGTNEVVVPVSTAAVATEVTIGLDLRFSARPTACTITLGWTDGSGGALTASTIGLTADQINQSVEQYARHVVVLTAPVGAANAGALKIAATGMPAGGAVDGDRVTVERTRTDGTAFDGTTFGGQWTGTVHLSTSVLAPIITIDDGECPLDVAVTYRLSQPSVTGGSMTSSPATLPSERRTWLTHPAAPATPVRVRPTVTPVLARPHAHSVYSVIGRANPIVVSSAQRGSPTGDLILDLPTFAERDALLDFLADGSPVLYREPAEYGIGYGWWLSIADVTEDAGGRVMWHQTRELTLPFTVVDAPLGPNQVAA